MFSQTIAGVILAGGQSERYAGRPKGLEQVGGVRIIDRVATALRPLCSSILLSANVDEAVDWLPGVPVVRDVIQRSGAIGGIHAAMTHAQCDVLVVAWDMPFVSTPLLRELVASAIGHEAAVPQSPRATYGVEPLCALYRIGCLGAIEQSIAEGDRRAVAILDRVRVARIPVARVAELGNPEYLFHNINTPEDLARANEYFRSTTAAHDCRPEELR